MNTTTLLAEVLVAGVFAFVWVALVLWQYLPLTDDQALAAFVRWKDWSSLVALLATAVAYQLGVLINFLAYGIGVLLLEPRIPNRLVSAAGTNYETVRAAVYQFGAEDVKKDLMVDLAAVRIARAGVLNFTFLTLATWLYGEQFARLGWVALMMALGCLLQWVQRYRRYYKRTLSAFLLLRDTLPALKSLRPAPQKALSPAE